MEIKTRYVFDRYHVDSDRRLRENADKLDARLEANELTAVQDGSASQTERVY